MTPVRKAALIGAAIGGALGVTRLALETPGIGDPGGPQTVPGLVALYAGYAVPWALIGAGIGYLMRRRGTSRAPETSAPALAGPPAAPSVSAPAPAAVRPPTTAIQRLGHVLGWTGNIIAAPLVLIGAYGFTQSSGDPFVKGVTLILGVLAFLIGRALRYIFAGSFR